MKIGDAPSPFPAGGMTSSTEISRRGKVGYMSPALVSLLRVLGWIVVGVSVVILLVRVARDDSAGSTPFMMEFFASLLSALGIFVIAQVIDLLAQNLFYQKAIFQKLDQR